jgi:hypothetical protein
MTITNPSQPSSEDFGRLADRILVEEAPILPLIYARLHLPGVCPASL